MASSFISRTVPRFGMKPTESDEPAMVEDDPAEGEDELYAEDNLVRFPCLLSSKLHFPTVILRDPNVDPFGAAG